MQRGSSHVLNRILTLSYTENNLAFTKIWVLYLAVVFSSQLSQVFEEKNALSLQLRGSSRNTCESHQHYNEVLNRCLVLERQLQELQSADKGMVRVVVLVQGREKLMADGSTNCEHCNYFLSSSFSAICHTFMLSFRSCLQQMLLQEHPKKRMSLREAVTHQNCRSCSWGKESLRKQGWEC